MDPLLSLLQHDARAAHADLAAQLALAPEEVSRRVAAFEADGTIRGYQTIIDADRICVVDNGRIAESGTHDELMRQRGSYHTFFATQFGERAKRIA